MSQFSEEHSKQVISCSCGAWEEMDYHHPRHKSQHFDWVSNIDEPENTANYTCSDCGSLAQSRVIHYGEQDD